MTTEKDILSKMDAIERELKSIRGRVITTRNTLWELESELITSKLAKDKLQAELKQFREDNFDPTDVERDEDIERFKKLLPELMKKEEKKE
jgi:hypothetical protein